ncbi:MAG: photosystem I assembly protein Ycf4 [Prochlorothrix sp.]
MTMTVPLSSEMILRRPVLGSRRPSNYLWAVVTLLGGIGFVLSSLSSYFQVNLLLFSDPTQLVFRPQGLVMGFYGVAALVLSTYLWLVISWDVGGGYNEFNRDTQKVTIFRWGFPGADRRVELVYDWEEVQSVRIDIKDGFNPKRALYLKIRGRGELPLTRVGQPLPISVLETQGAELARFLEVPLEGL